MRHHVTLIAAFLLLESVAAADLPECNRFHEIYAGGKELCENMWDGAFKYEQAETSAYTMWFFDNINPNDAVSRQAGKLQGDHAMCHLQYFHKDAPGPEPDTFTECHPWKENACCSHGTVETAKKLKEGYGAEYHWDRCGPLSPECERFFVQEACFYECDPNAGLFRKWNSANYDAKCDKYAESFDEAFAKANDCDHNTWQMHRMPIKASYCDAMFDACRNDRFCASNGGSYFSCAAIYTVIDAEAQQAKKMLNASYEELTILREEVQILREDGLSAAVIVGIVLAAMLIVLLIVFVAFLIRREKTGKPVFATLLDDGVVPQTNASVVGATHA